MIPIHDRELQRSTRSRIRKLSTVRWISWELHTGLVPITTEWKHVTLLFHQLVSFTWACFKRIEVRESGFIRKLKTEILWFVFQLAVVEYKRHRVICMDQPSHHLTSRRSFVNGSWEHRTQCWIDIIELELLWQFRYLDLSVMGPILKDPVLNDPNTFKLVVSMSIINYNFCISFNCTQLFR